MASKTDIANLTISHHAGEWVDDIDTAPGRMNDAIRALWAATLETALAAHPWKFAKRSWVNQPALPLEQNPDPDMPFAYRLPADCVRVFELRPKIEFNEWDRLVACNQGPAATLIGTRRGVEVGEFSAFFVDYFAAFLAWRICTPVSASEAIRTRCKQDMAESLALAKTDNGRAGTLARPFPDSFMRGRVAGSGPV